VVIVVVVAAAAAVVVVVVEREVEVGVVESTNVVVECMVVDNAHYSSLKKKKECVRVSKTTLVAEKQ
jgi:hypothetical protein